MTETAATSSVYATSLLRALIRDGIRDIVVCPGSRSQALALAAAEAEREGAIRLHVRLDERSAAFLALGIATETGMPAPVIVTSGTAVANLLPAALEAHEGRVPMLLLTADRPADMRGTRSNQTTRQAGLFADVARLALDIDVDAACDATPESPNVHDATAVAAHALDAALGAPGALPPGPVQLNLQFREPLSGWPRGMKFDFVGADHAVAPPEEPTSDARSFEPLAYQHEDDALTVVIAGAGAGAEAEAFARATGLPLLAEVVSGSRFGREAITAYASLIDDPDLGGLIERAVVFGHPTLTRQVPALLRRDDVEVVVVDPYQGAGVDHFNPGGEARFVRSARVGDSYYPKSMHRWLGAWVVADREQRAQRSTVHAPDLSGAKAAGYKERNAYARAELAVRRESISRELLAESIWRATWPHDRLMLAASRIVRALDSLAPPRPVEVRANRGLAGIDGTIATALGIATASQSGDQPRAAAGTTRVLIGDLALLHDAGSLLLPEAEVRPRIQVFVGNDGGGTIFDTLEAARSAPADAFDRVMYTPQRVDIEALARAYGWEYRLITSRGELERLLTEPVSGPQLVEVPIAR